MFTAVNAGDEFTVTPKVTNRPAGAEKNIAPEVGVVTANIAGVDAVAQQSTVTFTGEGFEAGDTYSITIDADGEGTEFESFTVTHVSKADESLFDIASALQFEITDQDVPLTVTVVESEAGTGIFDQLLIVADNAGTPFTVSANVDNRAAGANADNDAVVDNTQENVEAAAAQSQVSFVNFEETW